MNCETSWNTCWAPNCTRVEFRNSFRLEWHVIDGSIFEGTTNYYYISLFIYSTTAESIAQIIITKITAACTDSPDKQQTGKNIRIPQLMKCTLRNRCIQTDPFRIKSYEICNAIGAWNFYLETCHLFSPDSDRLYHRQHKVWRAIHNNFVWWKICFVFVRENSLNSFVCWMAKHSVPTVAQVYSELLQINAIYLKNMKNHI